MNTRRGTGLLWVTLLCISSKATATRTFCQAPPVFPGDSANLTCYFPEDLHQSRSFCVFRRDSMEQHTYLVLGCNWNDGQPICDGEEGYHLCSGVSYEVIVGIPSDKPGIFYCDTIPRSQDVIIETCHLTFKDAPRPSPRALLPSSTEATHTTVRREDDDASPTPSPTTVPPSSTEATKTTEGRGDSDGQLPVAIPVAVSVGLVIADLLVIGIVLLWLRRRTRRKSEDSHTRGLQPASVEEVFRLPTEEERRRTPEDNYIRDLMSATAKESAELPSEVERLPTFGDKFNRESQPASDEEAAELLTGEERSTIRSTDNYLAADPRAEPAQTSRSGNVASTGMVTWTLNWMDMGLQQKIPVRCNP